MICEKLIRAEEVMLTACRRAVAALALVFAASGHASDVRDLKYGAILFEYYQQKYFETLVEYDYAAAKGGIHGHGTYPELLKGGVSLSYGLDDQARNIFSELIARHTGEPVRNRAWFYLSKMRYLRGDVEGAAATLANVSGTLPADIEEEYRYLGGLINTRLGYFEEAERVSRSFDEDSDYAPYLYFNLGVAQGKQGEYQRAYANLEKATRFAGESDRLSRLADRAQMAIAYLNAQQENFVDAYARINRVSTTGVFSNRALLGAGWASVNSGAFSKALAPLQVLEQRSMAIPEVQEAVLLVPHVYEKMELPGRAARGFIAAHDRYGKALEDLKLAREALAEADVLELFVRNMDELLGESDWFGTAPAVKLNSLSPFMMELMADHSFQSVLKDLRDLYAIRNNLEKWKRKRDDFDVILRAAAGSGTSGITEQQTAHYQSRHAELASHYAALEAKAAALSGKELERVQWLLDDLRLELERAGAITEQVANGNGVTVDARSYRERIAVGMSALEKNLSRTNGLIAHVEQVLRKLVNAELDIHEERLKYYRVQSHLAKVRILDRSLMDLEGTAAAPADEEKPADDPDTAGAGEEASHDAA